MCVDVWMPLLLLGPLPGHGHIPYLHLDTVPGADGTSNPTTLPLFQSLPLPERKPFHKSRSPTVPGCKRPSQCRPMCAPPSLSVLPPLCIHASRTILLHCPPPLQKLPNLWVPNPGRGIPRPMLVCDRGRRHSCTSRHFRPFSPSVPARNPQSIGIFLSGQSFIGCTHM